MILQLPAFHAKSLIVTFTAELLVTHLVYVVLLVLLHPLGVFIASLDVKVRVNVELVHAASTIEHVGGTVSIVIVLDVLALSHATSTAPHPYVYVQSDSHLYQTVYVHLLAAVLARLDLYNSWISAADNARL